MRAVTVSEYGAAPALTDLAAPRPGPGPVLIRIEAAGVNPMDRQIAAGALQAMMPGQFPLILGSDLAGTVEAVSSFGADRPGRSPISARPSGYARPSSRFSSSRPMIE